MNCWEKIALENKNEDEKEQLTDLALLRAFLARKDVVKNEVKNVNETIFNLKTQYLPHNQEQGTTFIEDISSQEDQFTFETTSAQLKLFSRSTKEVENMVLKNKVLLGGWVSTAAKVFRRKKNREENLPGRFEDWMERECGIKQRTIYNYKNLYKLGKIAPKLMNCRVNMAYFIQHHKILINYFEEHDELWKHNVPCDFEACNSYFTEQTMTS